MVDNDFENLSLSILSATMIGSVKETKKDLSKIKLKKRENIEKLIEFKSKNELIILSTNIGNLTSIRVLNVSDFKIFNPIFKLIFLDENSKIIKTLLIKGDGPIDSKKERTYRSIKVPNFNSYKYINYDVKFVSAERLK